MGDSMERDNLIQIVTMIIAIVALILAVFAVAVPGNDDEHEDDDGDQGDNTSPTAVISASKTTVQIGEYLNLDGSSSSDSDGNIIEYTWDLGNGMKDSGMYALYMYSESGTYTISLIVIDDDGAEGNASTTVTVTPNVAPEAVITMDTISFNVGENAYFNASDSTDSDGEIVECTWDFGDGTKDSGMFSNHIFQEADVFSITLTVIDDDGVSDSDTVDVTIIETGGPPGNDPPVAEIILSDTVVETEHYFWVVGSNSTDTDGDIIAYVWDFGDGHSGYGIYFDHEYLTPGTYNVTLTVYDNDGAWDITNAIVTVIPYTPIGVLNFNKYALGNYTGGIISLSDEVLLSEASITIIDDSIAQSASQDPIQSGIPIQAGSGFWLKFTDTNANNKLDAGDVWVVRNGSHLDIIRLIYLPTSETITQYTFIENTPSGALSFTENTVGNYSGGVISLSDTLYIGEASIYIQDISTSSTATAEPIQSGVWLETVSGFKIKYTDSNGNGRIDAGDVWITEGTASGDILKLIYTPTGGYIAQYTFS